jgi:putative MATE family efflux protein
MTLPMIGGIFASMAFNLADTYYVGQLGTAELAAMSFTFPVVFLMISLAIGLGAGTSSVVARALGASDWRRARRLTTDALILAAIVVAGFSVAGVLTIGPVFGVLGASLDLLPLIRDYMTIWYAGVVFLVVGFVAMSAIRATGDSRLPAMLLIGAAIVNVVLDPLLIFGLFGLPRLELEGAAIATVLSRAGMLAIAVGVLYRRLGLLSFARPRWVRLAASWRRVLHVGLPAAGTNMIIPAATAAVMPLIAASGGTEAVAGFGVATRIEAMTMVVFYAMSSIMGPFAGQNVGAGRHDRIRQALRYGALFCVVWGAVIAVVLALSGGAIAALFNNKEAVVSAASLYLDVVPLSYGAAGIIMIVNAAFNGIGKPLPAVILSTIRMFGLYVPLAYAGASVLGLVGIFAAIAAANLVVGAVGFRLFTARALPAGTSSTE